jgi:hypothetical protein
MLKQRKKLGLKAVVQILPLVVGALAGYSAYASDHDDGELDVKGRAVNLTDLYAFRQDWQDLTAGGSANMVFIMNSNPRSLPGQQYFFSTNAFYDFHVSRVSNNDTAPTGADDVIIRFQFGAPDTNNHQSITVTYIADGNSQQATTDASGNTMTTTTLAESQAATPHNWTFSINSNSLQLFAGLREDPFFFDVETFFTVRELAASSAAYTFDPTCFPTGSVTTLPGGCVTTPALPGGATVAGAPVCDFTHGYNVNTIVLQVPIALLQGSGSTSNTTFDVWETIEVPSAASSI